MAAQAPPEPEQPEPKQPLWWARRWQAATQVAKLELDALWQAIGQAEQARISKLSSRALLSEADVQTWLDRGVSGDLRLGPYSLQQFVSRVPPPSLVDGQGRLTRDIYRAVPLGRQAYGSFLTARDVELDSVVELDNRTTIIRPQPLMPFTPRGTKQVLMSRSGLSMATTPLAAFQGAAARLLTKNPSNYISVPLASLATTAVSDRFRNPQIYLIFCAPVRLAVDPALRVENDFDDHVSVSAAREITVTELWDFIVAPALEQFRLRWVEDTVVFVCEGAADVWPDWFFDQQEDGGSGAHAAVEVLERISSRGSDQDFDAYCAINSALLASSSVAEGRAHLLLMHTLIEEVQANRGEVLKGLEEEVGQALSWIASVCQVQRP
eukprot:m.436395 g.436395  ORF g.436395 m.436395 type:complete len:381 (+) comp56773_c0_seq15:51-1193(+)